VQPAHVTRLRLIQLLGREAAQKIQRNSFGKPGFDGHDFFETF
jgi:hypothetical protein